MRVAAALVILLSCLVPGGATACGVLPDLGPLMGYARAVQSGRQIGPGSTELAARTLARQDRAALPRRLREAGQGDQAAPLLDFFGALGGVLDRAMAGDAEGASVMAKGDAFARAYAGAADAQTALCDAQDSPVGSARSQQGLTARVGGDGHGPNALRGASPYETPLAVSAQRVVLSFLTALSLVVIVHYALTWRSSALRRRRLVSIPAQLHGPGGALAGRVTVLEVQGAKFIVDKGATRTLPQDGVMTLSVGGKDWPVQVQAGGKIAHHIFFDTALSAEQHGALLKASMEPPRRDPMARDATAMGTLRYRYGAAHLQAAGGQPAKRTSRA